MGATAVQIAIIGPMNTLTKTVLSYLAKHNVTSHHAASIPELKDKGLTNIDCLVIQETKNLKQELAALDTLIGPLPTIAMTDCQKLDSITQRDGLYIVSNDSDFNEVINLILKLLAEAQSSRNHPVISDPNSQKVMALAHKVAASNVSVLISGESGVGKEVLARYIHNHSLRHKQAFVAVNCAAIPDNMLEAMLFGYEKGAFTGAIKTHPGKFEQAQHGSLLLDEISEMSLTLQSKLLRVLQEREVERLGSQQTLQLDVRIIATTNRNLAEEIAKGNFREDLFYRINVFPIHWIPLRERRGDIIPLAEHLVAFNADAMQRLTPSFSDEAKQRLLNHPWHGNAREMDNIMQRALILQPGTVINESDIHFDQFTKTPAFQSIQCDNEISTDNDDSSLKNQEYQLIQNTLSINSGNRTLAARQLKISTRTLRNKLVKMRELGLTIPKKRSDAKAKNVSGSKLHEY